MLESESLSMISLPNLSLPEMNAVPLTCWQDVCLSKIWIPGHLLTNRQKSLKSRKAQGIFHTLEKRDHAKQIESFSVYYSDSDNESETDIFESDSDDAFDFDSISSETMKIKDDAKPIRKTDNCSELKSFPAKSNISLIEILNTAKEVDITNFEFKKEYKCAGKHEEILQPNIKTKKAKKKNKVVNSVTLDKFLEDYTEQDKQEDYANDYLQKVLMSKNGVCVEDEIQLKNNVNFPDLKTKKIEFMHNNEPVIENLKFTSSEILTESDKDEEISSTCAEMITPAPEPAVGKIVIENIPSEMAREDILLFLDGYGEVKDFNLEQHGDFFKAFVEIDLMCDIDWIIECLNGTEPFGASSKLLKCYKQ